jgi:hypothetical protein
MHIAALPRHIGIRDADFAHLDDLDEAGGLVPIPPLDFLLERAHRRLLGLCCGYFL